MNKKVILLSLVFVLAPCYGMSGEFDDVQTGAELTSLNEVRATIRRIRLDLSQIMSDTVRSEQELSVLNSLSDALFQITNDPSYAQKGWVFKRAVASNVGSVQRLRHQLLNNGQHPTLPDLPSLAPAVFQ